MEPRVFTVSELSREAKVLLEDTFSSVWVEGEVSGLMVAASGHHYFQLKDEKAVLKAVLWASGARRLKFENEEGLLVRARGRLTIYEPRGSYQLVVDKMEPAGRGPLQVAFEQMRRRLEAEGLFDPDRKQPLPDFPRRVALVTSPTSAAVRDLIRVAHRRWPPLELVVVPVKVQGDGAADEIAAGIARADRGGFDLIIVGRGGGSLEDLWAFNEEVVARAIFAAETPVISAVGHEVDVSISDLVADLRAATPSAAAELATPDSAEVIEWLDQRRRRMDRALMQATAAARQQLATIQASAAFKRPMDFLRAAEQRLDDLADDLRSAWSEATEKRRGGLETLAASLEALSPLKVLGRGYSVTQKEGRVVTRAADLRAGDTIQTTLAEGSIRSTVE
ncbi:MAG: exodeoxyribonuclease VII large subunit [Planctomycetota bacterium]